MGLKRSVIKNIFDILLVIFSFVMFVYIGFILWMMTYDFIGCIDAGPGFSSLCIILKNGIHYLVTLVGCTGTLVVLWDMIGALY